MVRDGSVRAVGSLLELTALALHGDQHSLGDECTLIQHLSSAVAQSTSKAKLDTVNFTLADRASAWLAGTGSELRQLKELQLSDAPTRNPDCSLHVEPPSRFSQLRNRALVLLGAEDWETNREVGTTEGALYGRSSSGLVAGMVDLQLKAHVEAEVYKISRAERATAEEIVETVDDFLPAYPLSFWDRMYLRWFGGDEFSDDDRDVLLGRVPVAALVQARMHYEQQQQQAESDENAGAQRKRLSMADLADPGHRMSTFVGTKASSAPAGATAALRGVSPWSRKKKEKRQAASGAAGGGTRWTSSTTSAEAMSADDTTQGHGRPPTHSFERFAPHSPGTSVASRI